MRNRAVHYLCQGKIVNMYNDRKHSNCSLFSQKTNKLVSDSSQDSIIVIGKTYLPSVPSLRGLPKVALETEAEGGILATFFVHSSLLQAMNAMMLCFALVQTILQNPI